MGGLTKQIQNKQRDSPSCPVSSMRTAKALTAAYMCETKKKLSRTRLCYQDSNFGPVSAMVIMPFSRGSHEIVFLLISLLTTASKSLPTKNRFLVDFPFYKHLTKGFYNKKTSQPWDGHKTSQPLARWPAGHGQCAWPPGLASGVRQGQGVGSHHLGIILRLKWLNICWDSGRENRRQTRC